MSAKLNNYSHRVFMTNNVVDVFPENGFEIKFICCVEVRRNGFRIAVDHDGFVSAFLCSEHAVHARVIEFNTLTNAVRAASQYNNFFVFGTNTFILVFEGAVVIRSLRFELCRAGVYQFVHTLNAHLVALRIYLTFQAFQ